ncbi:hypothetical protein CRYUN_Cryun40dG0067200 [Craigia yunnanensis]
MRVFQSSIFCLQPLGDSYTRRSIFDSILAGCIPVLFHPDPRSRLETLEDAFDLAIKGILERIETVRIMIREGKDPSVGFADGDDYKYTFSPYENGI